MNLDKSKSRGINCDMSSSAVERRLEIVDELRELALELSRAERLGPVDSRLTVSQKLTVFTTNVRHAEE